MCTTWIQNAYEMHTDCIQCCIQVGYNLYTQVNIS